MFNDNIGALSALINGYASKPDMGRIVNAFHAAQFLLGARIWLEWVPSAANVADLPSRLLYPELMQIVPRSRWVPTVLPPLLGAWSAPFEALAESMSARFA